MKMSKLPLYLSTLVFYFLFGCYEPKEGCLNTDAVNYDVTADDPCGDCCVFPSLSLSMQHLIRLPEDTVSFQYGVLYPSEVNALDSFVVDRARYFISDLKLVKENGEEVGVTDSLSLEFSNGTSITVEDNFAKLDRDIFQARKIGTVLTEGVVTEIKFTFGLDEFLLQNELTSVISNGHPLDTSSDSLIYEEGLGYIPNLLILRRDTVSTTDSLEFRFFDPVQISLPLEAPFVVEKGFNIKLTLKVDYLDWFNGVDFEIDNFPTMEEKIKNNLSNVFHVTEIKLE